MRGCGEHVHVTSKIAVAYRPGKTSAFQGARFNCGMEDFKKCSSRAQWG